MRRWLLLIALCCPMPALAQGIDASWKDCVGTGNEMENQVFACTGTTNQSYALVLQFKLPVPIPNFVGLAAYVNYLNQSGAVLDPFWRYESGGCNNTGTVKGIAMFDNIQLLPNCVDAGFADPWDGDGSGGFEGIAAYGVNFRRPGHGYFILGDARAQSVPLEPFVNYYAFHLVFNNRNRATCAGCSEPGGLYFEMADLESNDGSPAIRLATPDKLGQCLSINDGTIPCPYVPAKPTTWGRIKTMYR